jgi:hypothetical protein
LGDLDYLRHTYLPADYRADVGSHNVVGSVHIEAVWDRARNAIEETEWLNTIDKSHGVAARAIAYVPLASPDAPKLLAAQAAHPRVVGVREIIRWHPEPARSWAELGIVDRPDFRAGVAALAPHDFVLELLMNPYQAAEVARLARDFPNQTILINHCCTPNDRDEAGIARWHACLARLAAEPNVAIKVSNFGAYSPDRSLPVLRQTVMGCIDAFGTARAMFGTDYPVARRNMGYGAMVDAFAAIISDFSAAEQRALFHDNAARYYRF